LATPTVAPTQTSAPTETPLPTSPPTRQPPPSGASGGTRDSPLLVAVFAVLWLSAVAYIGWSLWSRRQASVP
jgi:hypothetical protein